MHSADASEGPPPSRTATVQPKTNGRDVAAVYWPYLYGQLLSDENARFVITRRTYRGRRSRQARVSTHASEVSGRGRKETKEKVLLTLFFYRFARRIEMISSTKLEKGYQVGRQRAWSSAARRPCHLFSLKKNEFDIKSNKTSRKSQSPICSCSHKDDNTPSTILVNARWAKSLSSFILASTFARRVLLPPETMKRHCSRRELMAIINRISQEVKDDVDSICAYQVAGGVYRCCSRYTWANVGHVALSRTAMVAMC